jgi:spermidine synthase
MSSRFEEIDRRHTPIGEISVRRRLEPTLQIDVYEVKLGDEFLMSSLFTVAEIELARLALAEVVGGDLDVVVGGLGLGYTARAVLEDSRVRSMHVVEALGAVIEWHERDLLPLASELTSDPRCHLVNGDFFAMLEQGSGFGATAASRYHAVFVDIDHTPRHVLHPSHAAFYTPSGLGRLADRLHPGGVFALWSDGAPDRDFVAVVEEAFASCEAHVVTFENFHTGEDSASTVYVAKADND